MSSSNQVLGGFISIGDHSYSRSLSKAAFRGDGRVNSAQCSAVPKSEPGERRMRTCPGFTLDDLTSAATHRVAAIEALITSAVAHGDVPAAIADGGVTHHVLEVSPERRQTPLHGTSWVTLIRWGR